MQIRTQDRVAKLPPGAFFFWLLNAAVAATEEPLIIGSGVFLLSLDYMQVFRRAVVAMAAAYHNSRRQRQEK